MEEKQKNSPPKSTTSQKTLPQDVVVLDAKLFRTALIAAAIFLILLTSGTLWALFAIQDRQSEALREEFSRLNTELRSPQAEQAYSLALEPDADPQTRIDLLQRHMEAAKADLLAQQEREAAEERERQEWAAQEQEQNRLAREQERLLAEERLAQEREAARLATSKPPPTEIAQSGSEQNPPRVIARIAQPQVHQPEEANPLSETEVPIVRAAIDVVVEEDALPEDPALAASNASDSVDDSRAAVANNQPASAEATTAETAAVPVGSLAQITPDTKPRLPIRKFHAKARIKKNPRASNSGGLFITTPEERNKEKLKQETNEYLVKSNNLPLGTPVQGITGSRFGTRSDPFNRRRAFHSGIDFQSKTGTPIRTTADGMVIYSGFAKDYGHHVIISHGRDFETLYAHMSRRLVEKNRLVVKGQKIGLIGSTGRSTGPHLHYEIRHQGRVINPMEYVAGGKILSPDVKPSKRKIAQKQGKVSGKSAIKAKSSSKKKTGKKKSGKKK